MIRKRNLPNRRGVSAVEAAVVYPVTMLLLIGTVILAIAVFRYEQLQALAREGARYASVHGPTYASEQANLFVRDESDSIEQRRNLVRTGCKPAISSCSVTWNPNPPTTSAPSTVTVQLTYSWVPKDTSHNNPLP